ncbi:MAG: exodeoxyribonuclease III [Gammaproteobacteria bacterium]|nr:exodeoxyribonuclease III [Gammaproteobacteria bacterium]
MPLIASWNVNSVRVRLPHVLRVLKRYDLDLLAIQETKVQNALFPHEAFTARGYHVLYHGQKSYNGVAIISKEKLTPFQNYLPGLRSDPECRFQSVMWRKLLIVNVYVPMGQALDSVKYEYKLKWLNKLALFLKKALLENGEIIVLGDFNIAPDDEDVHDPELWRDQLICSLNERNILNKISRLGFHDSFRLFKQKKQNFSWWDYRFQAFTYNRGLRIDHILVSDKLKIRAKAAYIDKRARSWQRPSDHAPVFLQL